MQIFSVHNRKARKRRNSSDGLFFSDLRTQRPSQATGSIYIIVIFTVYVLFISFSLFGCAKQKTPTVKETLTIEKPERLSREVERRGEILNQLKEDNVRLRVKLKQMDRECQKENINGVEVDPCGK